MDLAIRNRHGIVALVRDLHITYNQAVALYHQLPQFIQERLPNQEDVGHLLRNTIGDWRAMVNDILESTGARNPFFEEGPQGDTSFQQYARDRRYQRQQSIIEDEWNAERSRFPVEDQLDAADKAAFSNMQSSGQATAEAPKSTALTTSNNTTFGDAVDGVAKETPVSNPNWFIGIPDTASVILPFHSYLTVVTPSDFTGIKFEFRLNSPYDPVPSSIPNPPTTGAVVAGRFNRKPPVNFGDPWPAVAPIYPQQTGAEEPFYRGWYDKIYDSWTCLGCDYEVTIHNTIRNNPGFDCLVAYGVDSFSIANDGRRFPNLNPRMTDAENWPDLKWKIVHSSGDNTHDGNFAVIKGHYKPGSAARNTQNDTDIKTWNRVESLPQLNEIMCLFFGNAELNSTNAHIPLMISLKLRYYIQFKDKDVRFRYPISTQGNLTLDYPADILQFNSDGA